MITRYKVMKENMVVQFNENHKWCGCLGIISEISPNKIMVGVPIPEQGTAYIFCKEDDFEIIGDAVLIIKEDF